MLLDNHNHNPAVPRYQSFGGKNKWLCGGALMCRSGYSQVHVTAALILGVWGIFIGLIVPIIDISPVEGHFYGVAVLLLTLNILSLLLTACTDPGEIALLASPFPSSYPSYVCRHYSSEKVFQAREVR